MLLKELTPKQREKICQYILDKYAPIEEDHMRHKIWRACVNCPFGDAQDCWEGLFDLDLSKELEEVIKDEI